MAQTVTEPARVLIIDDDPTIIGVLHNILRDMAQVFFARSGADGLRMANEKVPDLVLLDIDMPGMSGLEVCAAMKESSLLAEVPVVFITSHGDTEQEVEGLSKGAVDFIAKPPRAALVRARVSLHLRMKQMADALRAAASIDGLTGVADRRRFDEVVAHEWRRAERARTFTSLCLIDIDHFKAYNDKLGHPAGDACLVAVARAMKGSLARPADLIARYGGEEFVVLLPDTPADGGWAVANKLLQSIATLALPHPGSPIIGRVSVSIGVSTYLGGSRLTDQIEAAELVKAADDALYGAKSSGRDCVRFKGVRGTSAVDRPRTSVIDASV
jgi:diguanylate cyclase (GGDEF)-like protein